MKKVNDLFNLKNKNIVIAGGAGQIGFSFVEILSNTGANIILADLDVNLAKEKLSKSSLNSDIIIRKLDVSKKKSILKFADSINFDKIHGLINCFHFKGNSRKLDSSSSFFSGFEKYPEEAWDLVHNVNLKGTFLLSQALLDFMKDCNSSIINISSTYGIVSANRTIYGNSGINSPVAYATSKAALINLTRYMATHLSEYKIRVNCLSPGGVYNNQSEQFIKNYCEKTPLGRMATAEDYQGAVIFMLSEASSYMTGSNLVIDGGWTAW